MNLVTPEYPLDADNAEGTTLVLVELSRAGDVLAVSVFRSSGSRVLDRAALNAAKQSTYAPKMINCIPAAGRYLFRADFNLVQQH